MRLDFCAVCGETSNLENHHFTPKVAGGSDKEENLLTLCTICHDIFHGIGKKNNHKELQRLGIDKARKEGKYKGRASKLSKSQVEEIKGLISLGFIKAEIARQYGISRETLYQYIR